MSKLSWSLNAVTDVGLQREENQDSFFVSPDERVLVVADGLGGAAHGAMASKLAVDAVADLWRSNPPDPNNSESTRVWLLTAVRRANLSIIEWSGADPGSRPGTTIVIVVHSDTGVLNIAHVGDSRAYLVRGKEARPLTIDHSVVMEMARKYQLSEEQAWANPYRNYLTKCLGHDPDVEIELSEGQSQDDDWLLLCSDGLNSVLRDTEIAEVVEQCRTPAQVCEELVENVLWHRAPDNVTIIAVRFGERSKLEAHRSDNANIA